MRETPDETDGNQDLEGDDLEDSDERMLREEEQVWRITHDGKVWCQ